MGERNNVRAFREIRYFILHPDNLINSQGNVVQPVALYPIGGYGTPGVGNGPVRVTASTAYDAFGGFHGHTADGAGHDGAGNSAAVYEPAGFGGQFGYYHDYAGRYLLGHRYYDSFTGRFVTRDPIGYKGGINLYGFTGNNPVNESDPDGLDPNYYKNSFYRDPKHYHGPKPPLPDMPPGFDIDKNIAYAQKKWSAANPLDELAFKKTVQSGGTWDPKSKNDPKTNKPYSQGANAANIDDTGNFNFGATGKAIGASSVWLYRGAGSAQPYGRGRPQDDRKQHPEWGDPGNLYNPFDHGTGPYYGDDPRGHHHTNYGIMYYEYWWKPHHAKP